MLPKEKTPKKQGPQDVTMLIYGPTKIGKSTFCAHAPGALFLATEAGLNNLEVYQVTIDSWESMLDALKEISEGKHGFKTIIVDTIDNAYKMCAEYVCKKNGIAHESDLDWGKGWALVGNEFQRVLTKMSLLPYGLIMVSHSEAKDTDAKTGKYTKQMPTLPKGARQFVLSMVDLVLYCETRKAASGEGEAEERVIRTKPAREYEAGDRTGILPETLPLDYSSLVEALKGNAVSQEKPAKLPTQKKMTVQEAQVPKNLGTGMMLAGGQEQGPEYYKQFVS